MHTKEPCITANHSLSVFVVTAWSTPNDLGQSPTRPVRYLPIIDVLMGFHTFQPSFEAPMKLKRRKKSKAVRYWGGQQLQTRPLQRPALLWSFRSAPKRVYSHAVQGIVPSEITREEIESWCETVRWAAGSAAANALTWLTVQP